MKISIALAAADHDYKKGDRVIVKVAKDEWYLGSVVRAGAKIKVDFDDGASAVIEAEDFKDVRWMKKATKTLKRKATNAEAKEWSDSKRPVAAEPVKPKAEEKTHDPVENPGRIVEGGLIRLRHNRGENVLSTRIDEFIGYLNGAATASMLSFTKDDKDRVMLRSRTTGTSIGVMARIKFVLGTKGSLKISYSDHIVPTMRSTKWDAEIEGLDPGSRLEPLVKDFGKVQSIVVPADAKGTAIIQPIITRLVDDLKTLTKLGYRPVTGYIAAGLVGALINTERPGVLKRIRTASQDATWAERRELMMTLPKGFPSAAATRVLQNNGMTNKSKKGKMITLSSPSGVLSMSWSTPVKAGDTAVVMQHE